MRPGDAIKFVSLIEVSIHAPLVECDTVPPNIMLKLSCFYPRTPRGVRPSSKSGLPTTVEFLSTHPSWSATTIEQYDSSNPISFYPRTPRGVRRMNVSVSSSIAAFLSTHPSWSATFCLVVAPLYLCVSIHAPLVECDSAHSPELLLLLCFYPRTPRGVRLKTTVLCPQA